MTNLLLFATCVCFIYLSPKYLVFADFQKNNFIKPDLFDSYNGENLFEYVEDKRSSLQNILYDYEPEDDSDMDLHDVIVMSEAEWEKDELSEDERIQIIETINSYRSNYSGPIAMASDMNFVEYDVELEKSVILYLKECKLTHGRSKDDEYCSGAKPWSTCGQMLYFSNTPDIRFALHMFYKQLKYYVYETNNCTDPKNQICTYFTQLMWHNMETIGCGRVDSCNLQGRARYAIGCHVKPSGNVFLPGVPMYRYGYPCSRCQRQDGNLCYRGLCVTKKICRKYDLDCTCESKCQNCATHDVQNCKCICKAGYMWEDCSAACRNIKEDFPGERSCKTAHVPSQCNTMGFVQDYCMEFCEMCSPLNSDMLERGYYSEEELCCAGKICEPYHVLNSKCECEKLCPSPLCMYQSTKILNATASPVVAPVAPKVTVIPTSKEPSATVPVTTMIIQTTIATMNNATLVPFTGTVASQTTIIPITTTVTEEPTTTTVTEEPTTTTVTEKLTTTTVTEEPTTTTVTEEPTTTVTEEPTTTTVTEEPTTTTVTEEPTTTTVTEEPTTTTVTKEPTSTTVTEKPITTTVTEIPTTITVTEEPTTQTLLTTTVKITTPTEMPTTTTEKPTTTTKNPTTTNKATEVSASDMPDKVDVPIPSSSIIAFHFMHPIFVLFSATFHVINVF